MSKWAAGVTAVVTRIAREPSGLWWHIEADRQTFHLDFWVEQEPDLRVDDELVITLTSGDRKPGWTAEWMQSVRVSRERA